MSDHKNTLADQVKEAEKLKIEAETRKINIEIALLENPPVSKKKFRSKTIWTILVSVLVAIPIYGYYYEKVDKLIFDTQNLNLAYDNAKQKTSLKKIADSLEIVKVNLSREIRLNKKYLVQNNNLSDSIRLKSNQLSSISLDFKRSIAKYDSINRVIKLLSVKLNNYKHQIELAELTRDSLENEDIINSQSDKIPVSFRFKYKEQVIYTVITVVKTAINWFGKRKPVEFTKILSYRDGFTKMELFRGCKFILEIRDKRFKLKNNSFAFETTQDGSLFYQIFDVELESK